MVGHKNWFITPFFDENHVTVLLRSSFKPTHVFHFVNLSSLPVSGHRLLGSSLGKA